MHEAPFVGPFTGAEAAWTTIVAARSRQVPVRLWRRAALCGQANLTTDVRATAVLGEVLDHIEARASMFEDDEEIDDVSIWGPAHELVPELLDMVTAPQGLPGPHFVQLWVGGRGQATVLHEDAVPNVNCQIRGHKRFTVFSPDDRAFLYPSETRRGEYEVDPRAADLTVHPAYAQARPRVFTLQPGESIYIPPGWPHQVEYLDALTVNLSWWGPSQARGGNSNGA